MSLDVAAGLTGISKSYLSILSMSETGRRAFERRGLLEDVAGALGCSVVDLTGQPYLPPDRESAHSKRVIAQVERGLNEATLDDPPDLRPRPLHELAEWASASAELRDTAHYRSSGEDIDAVLIELGTPQALRDLTYSLDRLGDAARDLGDPTTATPTTVNHSTSPAASPTSWAPSSRCGTCVLDWPSSATAGRPRHSAPRSTAASTRCSTTSRIESSRVDEVRRRHPRRTLPPGATRRRAGRRRAHQLLGFGEPARLWRRTSPHRRDGQVREHRHRFTGPGGEVRPMSDDPTTSVVHWPTW